MSSYKALARHWRPRNFQAVVGQEVVVRTLKNALDHQRIHHAYLFTGSQGVGKTSLARLLAKCLSCEKGISSNPCGQCKTCVAIDEGHHVDFWEIDAASRTKVEDTRELLENVPYAPTQGRFKIYYIDESHMLSLHSFNALLKTLEEPPPHVIFILSTTDPQKLPVTILSRCLQFHLKRIPFEAITTHLKNILAAEQVQIEPEALAEIARSADGSLRDALSVLDQTIVFSEGHITLNKVRDMLGLSDRTSVFTLLHKLMESDATALLHTLEEISTFKPNYAQLLSEVLTVLHQLTVAQVAPQALESMGALNVPLRVIAQQISPETVQLFYEIGLKGQKDLMFAPTPKIGFEMTMLRMLAFLPVHIQSQRSEVSVQENIQKRSANVLQPSLAVPQLKSEPETLPVQPKKSKDNFDIAQHWNQIVPKLNISGLPKALMEHCIVDAYDGNILHLMLDESHKPLLEATKRYESQITDAIKIFLERPVQVKIHACSLEQGSTEARKETKAQEIARHKRAREDKATQIIEQDKQVQSLVQTLDAKIELIKSESEEIAHEDTK